ncbi:START domain-containing protein 10 [Podila epigama]|nr:START domain-containing protein 10 [Podila epigama]
MIVLVTPYTLLYFVNEPFRKVFGIPDLTERLFPSSPVHIQPAESVQPLKTHLAKPPTPRLTQPHEPSSSQDKSTTQAGCQDEEEVNSEDKEDAVLKLRIAQKKTTTIATQHHGKDPNQDNKNSIQSSKRTKTTQLLQSSSPYAKDLATMEKKFFSYYNDTEIWVKAYEQTSPSLIEVYQFKGRPMCYKIVAVMDNTPAVVFDTLCDLDNRSAWDPMCVEARVVEQIDAIPGTTIQYIRTKAVWPTASRDTVVLGTVKDLVHDQLFMVNASIEHGATPERVQEKIVRMETTVAGHIISPEPGQPNKSRLVQILDADLKGWIPDKVIQMVSTKAVPDGIRNVNKLIPTISPYNSSKILSAAEAMNQRQREALNKTGMTRNSNVFGHEHEEEEEEEQDEHLLSKVDKDNNTYDDDDDDIDASPKIRRVHHPSPDENNDNGNDEDDNDNMNNKNATHELRKRRESVSESTTLATLANRLSAVESEIGMNRLGAKDQVQRGGRGRGRECGGNSKALEKLKEPQSAFGIFWEGLKETFGFGTSTHSTSSSSSFSSRSSGSSSMASSKANKVLVAVIVVAVLGSTAAAKLRRR